MCSVRHRPMPSAPNSRATWASRGRSALVRMPKPVSSRPSRAAPLRTASVHCRKLASVPDTFGVIKGNSPSNTSPVLPSMVSHCPSLTAKPSMLAVVPLITTSLQPATHGVPMPRAHHRRMRGHAAGGSENALRGVHAADVLGRGFAPHQQHAPALLRPFLGGLGGEHHLAGGRARRRVQTLGQRLHLVTARGVDHRVQELVELVGSDATDRLFLRDQPLGDHVHRQLDGGRGRCACRSASAAGTGAPAEW